MGIESKFFLIVIDEAEDKERRYGTCNGLRRIIDHFADNAVKISSSDIPVTAIPAPNWLLN